jgi:putative Mn2+ efflux pump MntP
VAWIAPMLATAAFVIAVYYGRDLIRHQPERRIAMTLFVAAFVVAAIAGLLGALITKKAPIT